MEVLVRRRGPERRVDDLLAAGRGGGDVDRHGAFDVRAPDVRARQVGEHIRVRVAEGVAAAGRHQRHGRVDHVEEPLGVRRTSVVRDLQHVGTQPLRGAEQTQLRLHLGVAGEQQDRPAVLDAQDDRALVEVAAEALVGRGAEHLGGRAADPQAVPCDDVAHRHIASARGGPHGFHGRRHATRFRPSIPRDVRRRQEQPDADPAQHGRQPAGVVVVRVRQHDSIQDADPRRPQGRERRVGLRAAVDEDAGAGHLDEHGIALPDVEDHHPERRGGRRLGHRQDRRDDRRGGEQRRRAREAPAHRERGDGDYQDGRAEVLQVHHRAASEQLGAGQDDARRQPRQQGDRRGAAVPHLRDERSHDAHDARHGSGRDGDEVGRDGRDRGTVAREQQDRCHTDLRPDARPDQLPQRHGAADVGRHARTDDEDTTGGEH